jgi:hypothetical protein
LPGGGRATKDEQRQLRRRLPFETPPDEFTEVSGEVRRGLADDHTGALRARQTEIEDLVARLSTWAHVCRAGTSSSRSVARISTPRWFTLKPTTIASY